MPQIRLSKDVDYVTMINYFAVAPQDQQAFAEIEVKEIDKYGDNMDSALAASFHRSIEGSRVFNYAHWKSKEALEASQQTEEFKAHIDRMSHLDFTPDPRVYEVIDIYGTEKPKIDSKNDNIVLLTMIYTKSATQKKIVEQIKDKNFLLQIDKIISSHLLQSKDGERVAIYVQCQERANTKILQDSWQNITELAEKIEILPYEVLGSYR